jgi:hypothetical protein
VPVGVFIQISSGKFKGKINEGKHAAKVRQTDATIFGNFLKVVKAG